MSGLNRLARQALEQRFPPLWVAGEVSNLRRPASGHLYFSLKDEGAQIACAMFRSRAQLMPFRLQDGMRVTARALVTIYETRGDFQLNVETLRAAGVGALFEAFTRLRDRLQRDGVFADERKRPLPRFPRGVAVVTSLQAAALTDVLAALSRRCPHLPVVILPAPVQGAGAAEAIAAAIESASRIGTCDVLIVARGGGSIEDLWSFNEEHVARAIAASPIPVITGIGHESDTTIADLAADRRAATPTAAAEIVSAGFAEARQHLAGFAVAMRQSMQRGLETRMQRVDLLARGLVRPMERLARLDLITGHLAERLRSAWQRRFARDGNELHMLGLRLVAERPDFGRAALRLAHLRKRLMVAHTHQLGGHQTAVAAIASHLDHLNPQAVLRRGYSIIRKGDGRIVHSRNQVAPAELLILTFGEGQAFARVTRDGEPPEPVARAGKPD